MSLGIESSEGRLVAPLLGRELELERLLALYRDVERGAGALALLAGEPGIGKTRLAEELARHAERRGAVIAWGTAWDGGGAPAYWPWTQVVRSLQPQLPEPGPALRRDLGPLWGIAAEPDSDSEDPEALHFRRCDALRSMLAHVANNATNQAPLLVFLDDLHAADQATLRALLFVARSLRNMRVLVVGTHRDSDTRLRSEVGALLAKVAREGTPLVLGRLGREAMRQLVGDLEPFGPRLFERVCEASGGNPFFLHEILRLVRSGVAADQIPDGARMLVQERLAQLDEPSRSLLGMAAVLGREMSLVELGRLVELSRHDLNDRLRAPRLAGVVDIAREQVAFSHSLFRECLYERLLGRERAQLHLRAADVLASDPGAASAESVARHYLLALPLGDPGQAVDRARRTATGCRRALAFDRAVELLELAQGALKDDVTDRVTWLDVSTELAEALVFIGQGERSRKLCTEIASLARDLSDSSRFARAALAYGAEIRIGVEDPIQVDLLEKALCSLDASETTLRALVMARLSATRPSLTAEEPIAMAQEAIALARATGDGETLLQALHHGGATLVCYASPSERRDAARELASLAMNEHELVLAQRGYQRWAFDAAELGNREELDAAVRAEAQLGKALGHARFRWKGALLGSMLALIDGRWADSLSAIEQARQFIEEADDEAARAAFVIHQIGAYRARMRECASEIRTLLQTSGFPTSGGAALMSFVIQSSLAARWGQPERARAILERLMPLPSALLVIQSGMVMLADVAWRLDHRALAERVSPVLDEMPNVAQSWGAIGFIWDGFLAETRGGLLAVLGRTSEAVEQAELAIEGAQAFGARPALVEGRVLLARLLADQDAVKHRARIVGLLVDARRVASELDMQTSLARITNVEQKLGSLVTPQPAASAFAFSIRCEGEVWAVTYGESTARFKHSRAFDLIKELTDHPGREFHVLDFGTPSDEDSKLDLGDAGEVIDRTAQLEYVRRAEALRGELAEADRWNDTGRRERLSAELEFIEDELARGVGSGGKLRRSGAAAERARVNVTKRIRGLIERISEPLPDLASHLKRCVKTGTFVSYQPEIDARHGP